MGTVLRTGKAPLAVKNLGWLLRHWRDVQSLGFNYRWGSKGTGGDGELVARLRDGGTYITDYASLSVAWNFLLRPVFIGLPFELSLETGNRRKAYTIGDAEWKWINNLEYTAQHAMFVS